MGGDRLTGNDTRLPPRLERSWSLSRGGCRGEAPAGRLCGRHGVAVGSPFGRRAEDGRRKSYAGGGADEEECLNKLTGDVCDRKSGV